MKGVFKCGLFGALFAVSSIVLFTGYSVSAASPVDDVIQLTDSTMVQCYDSYDASIIGEFDARNQWHKFLDPSVVQVNAPFHASDTAPLIRPDSPQLYQNAYDMWQDRLDDLSGWSVSFTGSPNKPRGMVITIFSNTNPINFLESPHGNSLVAPAGSYQISVSCRDDGVLVRATTGNSPIIAINQNNMDDLDVWFVANDINYPQDYEGQVAPETAPPAEAIAHKPNITWSVNDKDVIVYSDDAKNTAVLEDYQIYWFISNTSFAMEQPTEPFALSGCTAPDYNNNFTVPIHFDYGIQAYYADQDCNILQVDDEGNRLADNMEVLTIDGSTFDGSTTDHEAIIGEVEVNAILQAIRKFRPNDGGLAGLIYAPIEAVATLPTIVGSCSPITLPLLGENVSLECIRPTIQASPMGVVYNTISVIVTGIVTWWVAWRTFGTIKNIQDPQDDRVEVLKL